MARSAAKRPPLWILVQPGAACSCRRVLTTSSGEKSTYVIELASEPDRYSLASVEEDGAEEDERRGARGGGDRLAIAAELSRELTIS